jgi:hypothetical protein
MPEPRGAVLLSCNPLFLRRETEISQALAPDPSPPRAREVRQESLRQSSRPAARHPQSQAAPAQSSRPAAERAGVEREGIAAFDAVPLEGLQEELRHPVAPKPCQFAPLYSTQALHTMLAYDAAWIRDIDDDAHHPQR